MTIIVLKINSQNINIYVFMHFGTSIKCLFNHFIFSLVLIYKNNLIPARIGAIKAAELNLKIGPELHPSVVQQLIE